jgi:hypothetical protein
MDVNYIDAIFEEPYTYVLIAVTIAGIVFEAHEDDLPAFLVELTQKVDACLKDKSELAAQDVTFPDVGIEAELLLKLLTVKLGFSRIGDGAYIDEERDIVSAERFFDGFRC